MLFNSWEFLLLFLPLTFAVFFVLGARSHGLAASWLAAASVFFYGWWNPAYVPLLLFSIVANFLFGHRISAVSDRARVRWLQAGLLFNLLLLGYYKYAHFVLSNVGSILGLEAQANDITLPLGISFFTFTQIAYLVDTYQAKVREYRFVHYALFVTYFPHLIAGPILHHAEMMPQFSDPKTYRLKWENVSVGTTIFVIGLAKKLLVADYVAKFVPSAFASGADPGFFEAWCGALAYTAQLYFDFSGYSDMAIGLSRLFGIHLPLNFSSPYKALNIAEFWRCWHMTLSRFLRDYLYVPLGGNRHGTLARYRNLMVTMLLGGLWHGAGWTFVAWGGLHGAYLVVHRLWGEITGRAGAEAWRLPKPVAWLITFLAVVVAWVFFRAPDLISALSVLKGMAGMRGVMLPEAWIAAGPELAGWLVAAGIRFGGVTQPDAAQAFAWVFGALVLAVAFPNSQQIMTQWIPGRTANPVDEVVGIRSRYLVWRPGLFHAMLVGGLFVACLLRLGQVSEFLYFQF